jgi:hypothetical protein
MMCTRRAVSGEFLIEAYSIHSFETRRTGAANSANPLDAYTICHLDLRGLSSWTELDYPADSFVTSHLPSGGGLR